MLEKIQAQNRQVVNKYSVYRRDKAGRYATGQSITGQVNQEIYTQKQSLAVDVLEKLWRQSEWISSLEFVVVDVV